MGKMKQLKKIKLKDVVKDQPLDVEQMSKITGGVELFADGCASGVCNENRAVGTQFCTDAVCTSGVGVCTSNT